MTQDTQASREDVIREQPERRSAATHMNWADLDQGYEHLPYDTFPTVTGVIKHVLGPARLCLLEHGSALHARVWSFSILLHCLLLKNRPE